MSGTRTTLPLAFSDEDLRRANAEWGCSCGPAALAACLGWSLEAVRPHLGDFEFRGYMNVSTMRRAILSAGFGVQERSGLVLPTHGLCRVQWGGPWMNPGVHPGAASARTHWIATKYAADRVWVFDVNGGWMGRAEWDADVAPRIMESIKKSDGTYTFTHRWEVRRRSG